MGSCLSKQTKEEDGARVESKARRKDETKPQRPALDLSQFELRRVIGRGAFGKVKVVVHKASGNTYALKYISKAACVARQAGVNVIRERKIMEVLHHPLVCNLRYAFQDVEYLYLVSDLMLGGDMRFHLLRKTFTEDAIRLWIAETAAALSYCHSRGIVHRDVKPDNILMTAEGHCKLADFNISTQIRGGSLPRTRSGSLYYMAPEIHDGRSYDFSVDYWSLGIVLFEAIYGHRPFFGKNSTDVASNIRQTENPQIPCSPPVSPECQAAIKALLCINARSRCQSLTQISALPFFSSLDWGRVSLGQASPVFVPGGDKNFDAAWELEEILLHDSPLEPRRQASKKKIVPENQAAADMLLLMETHFTDFDYTTATGLLDEKFGILQHPSNLISETALCSGMQETTPEGFVDVDEKVIAEDKDASSDVPPATDQAGVKERGSFFKSKPKKPVIVPAGVLCMKAGGRTKVTGGS